MLCLSILFFALSATPALAAGRSSAKSASTPPSSSTSSGAASGLDLNGIGLQGLLGWDSGLGLGGRYMWGIPGTRLLKTPSVKDQLALDLGVDFMHWGSSWGGHHYSWNELRPTVGLLWAFQVAPKVILYPKLDVGYGIGWMSDSGWDSGWGTRSSVSGVNWDLLAGCLIHLSRGLSLKGEIGTRGLGLGVQFAL